MPLVALSAGPAARPPPQFSYTMSRAVWRRIVSACHGRHEERCALLFGRGRRIERLRWLRNRDPLPELACTSHPDQRVRIWRQERSQGWVLLGHFHSHTAGPAVPSRADCAIRDRLLVIYSDVYADLRAWRVKRTSPQTLRAERGIQIDGSDRAQRVSRR